jgi:hypothetical protein
MESTSRNRLKAIASISLGTAMALGMTAGIAAPAMAVERWTQDFEAGTSGYLENGSGEIQRVASGVDGIASPQGGNHAVISEAGIFTRFGGYAPEWEGTWSTSTRMYLDPAWTNGSGFDYSVATNGSNGNHLRDFIFHATKGADGRLLVGVSNNSSNSAPNPNLAAGQHAEITTAGWYTLQHRFVNKKGVLAVEITMVDGEGRTAFEGVLTNPSDTIDKVGGNRYGWFTVLEGIDLHIDDVQIGQLQQEPGTSYSTTFRNVAITKAAKDQWRMAGNFDAAISREGAGSLRISNAKTSGSFGDQLFSPSLTVGAKESDVDNTFTGEFTILPVDFQKGLAIGVSPDDGNGGRNGLMRISHEKYQGVESMRIEAIDYFFDDQGDLKFAYRDVARGLDLDTAHTVKLQVVKFKDGTPGTYNDIFRASVDGGPALETGSFEAYFGEGEGREMPEANSLLFRASGTAAPDLLGQGLLIDNLSMSVSTTTPTVDPEPEPEPEPEPTDPTPEVKPETPKQAKVKATTTKAESKIKVNVNPNSRTWKVKVAKRTDGQWKTLKKTYRTSGNSQKVVIDLPKGKYRVVLPAQGGFASVTSGKVTLSK